MKSATNREVRSPVDLLGRPDLLHAPFVHHGDAIGHRHRLTLVVGDEYERGSDLPLDLGELDLEAFAQLEVERSERLVQKQHRGTVDQRASNRDTLLLATGELSWIAVRERSQAPPARLPRRRASPTSRRGTLAIFSPKATLSLTLMCGNSA